MAMADDAVAMLAQGLDKAMGSMNLIEMSEIMDKFETQVRQLRHCFGENFSSPHPPPPTIHHPRAVWHALCLHLVPTLLGC